MVRWGGGCSIPRQNGLIVASDDQSYSLYACIGGESGVKQYENALYFGNRRLLTTDAASDDDLTGILVGKNGSKNPPLPYFPEPPIVA